MQPTDLKKIFSKDVLEDILPPHLSDDFFEALYGDASEGAYDIRLAFNKYDPERKTLVFEIQLHERPGKCLACNLTYGLPEVFSRHPLININGMVEKIVAKLDGHPESFGWKLGRTRSDAATLHAIPLMIHLG